LRKGVPERGIIGTWEWPQNVVAVVLPYLGKKIPHSVIACLLNVNRLTVLKIDTLWL